MTSKCAWSKGGFVPAFVSTQSSPSLPPLSPFIEQSKVLISIINIAVHNGHANGCDMYINLWKYENFVKKTILEPGVLHG